MEYKVKNKALSFFYYLIHWTWGILPNIIGTILLLVFLCTGARVYKYRNAIAIQTKFDFGGAMEMGMYFILGTGCDNIRHHEYGHTIQTLWWGSLFPFVIGIPSALRFLYREHIYKKDREKYYKLPDYDAIWFEGQATKLGQLANEDKWSWL